jgi:hypothetical protein
VCVAGLLFVPSRNGHRPPAGRIPRSR